MMVFFWWRSPVEDTVVRTRLLQSTQEHARSRTLDDHKSGPFLSDGVGGGRPARYTHGTKTHAQDFNEENNMQMNEENDAGGAGVMPDEAGVD